MKKLKKIYIIFNSFRFIIHWLYIKDKLVFRADLLRWSSILRKYPQSDFFTFSDLMLFFPEFRALFYARLKVDHQLLTYILKFFAKPQELLSIAAKNIDGGLYIQHGFATIIAPESIGKNCWINQNVTIGYTNATDCPTIGDNVTIGCGAKVLGKCIVGNNCIIGANAVVVKNVPDNCTVVGNPARIIKKNGIRVDEKL